MHFYILENILYFSCMLFNFNQKTNLNSSAPLLSISIFWKVFSTSTGMP